MYQAQYFEGGEWRANNFGHRERFYAMRDAERLELRFNRVRIVGPRGGIYTLAQIVGE